jgi:hypothetical protein
MSGKGFEVVDNDNDGVFEFHEASSQQEMLLRCIYRQKVTYRYADGTYTKGEIREEQCCCYLPRYTIRWLVGCPPLP